MNRSKKIMIILFFNVVWIAITILSLTFGTVLNWPDFVHVDYGVPFTWSTHTLSTIAGPADTWRVDISLLAWDLIFWLGILTVVLALLLYWLNRKI